MDSDSKEKSSEKRSRADKMASRLGDAVVGFALGIFLFGAVLRYTTTHKEETDKAEWQAMGIEAKWCVADTEQILAAYKTGLVVTDWCQEFSSLDGGPLLPAFSLEKQEVEICLDVLERELWEAVVEVQAGVPFWDKCEGVLADQRYQERKARQQPTPPFYLACEPAAGFTPLWLHGENGEWPLETFCAPGTMKKVEK